MLKYHLSTLLITASIGLVACGGDDNKESSSDAPVNRTRVIFSPATGDVPVPSDLQFSAEIAQDGTMNAYEDPENPSFDNPVIVGIDFLDGNSVLAPFDIAFDASLDDTQTLDAANFIASDGAVIPNPSQNVFLLPLVFPSGDSLLQAKINEDDEDSIEVPSFYEAIAYQTAAATADVAALGALASAKARAELISLNNGTNNVIRINPLEPLMPKTKYLVVVTNVNDASGNKALPSEAYQFLKDPDTPLEDFGAETEASLDPLRAAIQNWEQLASGYFAFKQTVFDAANVPASAPTANDIIFSMTFTTGGTTDVLAAIAAPESFFEASLSTNAKKDAIVKVVTGQYGLDGSTNMASPSATDIGIAQTLNSVLTSDPTIPESIRTAVAEGADWSTLSSDSTAAHIIQKAAAGAAIAVNDGEVITLAQEAAGTVQAIVDGVSAVVGTDLPVSAVFPVPAARPSTFFRQDAASDISELLLAPAQIFQGEITLPYYQEIPTDTDPSIVKTTSWTADSTIGSAIDAGAENDPGTTPPSSMVTYRYPFPAKKSDLTVPLLVTLPDSATLGAFGITKPDEGWPVIIFQHGIGTERSTSLALANALAFACVETTDGVPTGPSGAPCYASVAIDQPLHGVAPSGSLFPGIANYSDPDLTLESNIASNTPSEALTERHFNLTADEASNPIPMDYSAGLGSSGSLFLNLTGFANARDNLRQMSVDLMNLAASVDTMDLDGDGTANELDPANLYFIGYSLGAINGLPFVAVNNSAATQSSVFSNQPQVKAAAGLMAGGGIVRLLTNSQDYASRIFPGLAAASEALAQGQSGLETYFSVFQGVVDSADVMNFASSLADRNSNNTGVLLTEVIGDGDSNQADTVIPNAADESLGTGPLSATISDSGFVINNFPAPLAGTEPMVNQFEAIATAAVPNESDGDPEVIITRFTQGTHGTPASADVPEVFAELTRQIVTFFAQDGVITGSIISDTSVVEE